ncbi:hypothetical protein N0V82_001054 [Gnomoniopsis sp. IMI 355080]|nr:hypothetical protein N0V82_001054 [Gnomoniopsis sp. IMI 355080]
MALKRFNADLRSARHRLEGPGIPGLVALEHGEAEGEALVTFVHEKLTDPIQIRFVAAKPELYPDDNNFLLYTNVQNAHPAVTSTLEDLQNFTFGQTVFESLRDVSSQLIRALNGYHVDANGDAIIDDAANDDSASGYGDEEEDFEELDFNGEEDPIFGLGSLPAQQSSSPRERAKMAPGVLNKIRRDLRKAREAGAKIGILCGVDEEAGTHMISLSIRARKLGISDEALEAWDIDPSDYIVLLFRVYEPYPSAEKLSQLAASSFHADFRFGKCKKCKPSSDSARKAFNTRSHTTTAEQDARAQATDTNADSHPFSKLFISNSMELFMNEYFLALTKLRMIGHQSWDDANSHLLELSIRNTLEGTDRLSDCSDDFKGSGGTKGSRKRKDKEVTPDSARSSSADAPEAQTLPTILTWNSFAESTTDISIPLVAMQFALHYFVRCTEYCLRCHRKVKKEFEALKPYVCEEPLCLFQYIAMGFGPSIEHEILSQPYVVDLLVTLCYSSVQEQFATYTTAPGTRPESPRQGIYPIRDFPTGLRLKVPSLPPSFLPAPSAPFMTHVPYSQPKGPQSDRDPEAEHNVDLDGNPINVLVDFGSQTMSVERSEDFPQLTENSWVVLRHISTAGQAQSFVHQVYLKSIDALTNSAEFEIKHRDKSLPTFLESSNAGPQAMQLYKYDFELDDLDNAGKAKAITAILATTPPISHLREYLIKHPHSRLKSYPGISSSSATLLEWIVASNRSFILQVNHVNDVHSQDKDLLERIKTRDQEVIPALSQGHVQFRFAMGNPDKELRFQRALKGLEAPDNPYPTLFAWHGSAIHNWHSILRQGLDFKHRVNGRAFGDGVYFSNHWTTSQGYAHGNSTSWPNSALKPNSVIALCEIINAPAKYISSSPHYVVQQLDWIQCRYLFIQPVNSISTPSSAADKSVGTLDELPQDPTRRVYGPRGEILKIPRKALPSSRGGKGKTEKLETTPPKRLHSLYMADGDTDEEDPADLDALFSDEESPQPPRKRVQALAEQGQSASRGSSVDAIPTRQWTAQRPLTPPKQGIVPSMTDFRPGTLDLKAIPRLGLPEWANAVSSKRLASDIRIMQKVQETTPLHELGWYIDFSNIDNMFQWIVELHTFDPELPLAKDMKKAGITSVVLEVRFGRDYPLSPPFIRVIRPKFLPFMNGGGGHVTIGGAICMEVLTSTGWTVAMSMESILIQVKMAMSSLDPRPARLQKPAHSMVDYSAHEALDAFQRFANRHNWKVPSDVAANATRV